MDMPRLSLAAALLAAALAASAAAQPTAQTIQVYSYGFGPHPIHLAAGQPVTLVFVNQSGSSHDFTAHRFFASSTITAGAAPDGEIDLAPHQTKSVTLVPRAGTYPAHCSHFMHAQLGMRDEIVVS
jgi:plastocyanin